MTYKDIRNSFAQADAIRDAGIQIPAGVSRQRSISPTVPTESGIFWMFTVPRPPAISFCP